MRSMTGYARREAETDGVYLMIELKSLNNRMKSLNNKSRKPRQQI